MLSAVPYSYAGRIYKVVRLWDREKLYDLWMSGDKSAERKFKAILKEETGLYEEEVLFYLRRQDKTPDLLEIDGTQYKRGVV